MLLNKAVIDAASEQFRLLFNKGLAQVQAKWNIIAMEVPSGGSKNTYGWLKEVASMREWLGERVIHSLGLSDYTIVNKNYELTVAVPRNAIEDDELGAFSIPFLNLGDQAAKHPDKLVWALLLAGFTELCHDGKAFFATDHPNGKAAAWSNKGTKKISATNFSAAYAAMVALKNEHGDPLGIRPTQLVHSAAYSETVFNIVKADKLASGAPNPNYNKCQAVEVEWLGDSAAWFLVDTSRPFLKPIILQRRKQPQFVAKDNVTDDNVFDFNEFRYGVDDRKNVGFSLPQLAYGSTGADAA